MRCTDSEDIGRSTGPPPRPTEPAYCHFFSRKHLLISQSSSCHVHTAHISHIPGLIHIHTHTHTHTPYQQRRTPPSAFKSKKSVTSSKKFYCRGQRISNRLLRILFSSKSDPPCLSLSWSRRMQTERLVVLLPPLTFNQKRCFGLPLKYSGTSYCGQASLGAVDEIID